MMKAMLIALLAATSGLLADSASTRQVKEIWVPEAWNAPEATNTKGVHSYKPSMPASFKDRRVGVVLNVGAARVSENRRAKSSAEKTYTLLIGDRRITVSPRKSFRMDGHRYRVVGEKDGALIVQDRRTKAIVRFHKQQTKPKPKTSSPADDE
jgi:hypothetical protein